MKNLTRLAMAACAFLSVHAALAQGAMEKKPMKMGMTHRTDPMMGLTATERKVATMHMKKMTPAEMAVHQKEIKALQMGKTKAQTMAMMSASEKSTYAMMVKKMTPMEKKVAMKIEANATMHGKSMKKM